MRPPAPSPPATPWPILIGACLAVGAIGAIDLATGVEVRVYPLYFAPIAWGAWRLGRATAVLLALLSTASWVVSNWQAGRSYQDHYIWPINTLAQLIAFGSVGLLVSELRRRLLTERDISRRDPLTSLYNSRAFSELGQRIIAMARRTSRPLTFAYIDLDHFKLVNDRHGHLEGDRVLAEVAALLRRELREVDLVARLGGDEFAIVLVDCDDAGARVALERVRVRLNERMRAGGWPVTASIGAMTWRSAPVSIERAIGACDVLMYRAKTQGKDRVYLEVVEPDSTVSPATLASPSRA
ncbi:MAG: GGDEF domain-containing protein [Deltaproteobacteria bacterium]|nr:GGDEF domain-containing protein [Deltaproteobacteria bacterium]